MRKISHDPSPPAPLPLKRERGEGGMVHATAIALAVDADGPLAGVLVLGPSGAGKSSLALSLIEGCPFRRTALIADDQVLVSANGEASAPKRLQGLIEVRGFGPARAPWVRQARLAVAFDLGAEVARVPVPERRGFGGGPMVPVFPLRWAGAEGTAAHRLRVIVRQVLCGQMAEETQDTRP